MKEKPKFSFALQVIVMIVIITLKKCSEWKHPYEETVFLFSQSKIFGKHVKKTMMLLTEQMLKRRYDTIVRLHIFQKLPSGNI